MSVKDHKHFAYSASEWEEGMFELRVKALLAEKKISQADLSRRLGVSAMAVSGWLTGRRQPDLETIGKIAQALDVPVSTLVDDVPPPSAWTLVPIYKHLRCGTDGSGAGVTGEVVDQLPFLEGKIPKGLFGIIAAGDSMFGAPAWIHNGAYVIFSPCAHDYLPNGKVCCMTVEGFGDPICKRICIEPTGLVLTSDNPAYPPIFVKPGQKVVVHGVWYGSWQPAPKNGHVAELPAPYGG